MATPAEIRKTLDRLHRRADVREMGEREVAKLAGCSRATVSRYRARLRGLPTQPGPVSAAWVRSLPARYELLRPIGVAVQPMPGRYAAHLLAAGIAGKGDTPAKAVADLRAKLLAEYVALTDAAPADLTKPEAERLAVLGEFIRRSE